MASREATSGSSEMHILAVDDSLLDRKLIERLFNSSSYRVTTVESGKRALEWLGVGNEASSKKPKVNMIITDYCMPEMTGFDLLKRVKFQKRTTPNQTWLLLQIQYINSSLKLALT